MVSLHASSRAASTWGQLKPLVVATSEASCTVEAQDGTRVVRSAASRYAVPCSLTLRFISPQIAVVIQPLREGAKLHVHIWEHEISAARVG